MYQKGTRGTVLFVPFKRKGKYNPSLARFCILLALLIVSCTMSHLQMLVSDEGWKVAPVGGAAMSRALSQVGLGPEGIPCDTIRYLYKKIAILETLYELQAFFRKKMSFVLQVIKWIKASYNLLPSMLKQQVDRNFEVMGRKLNQNQRYCHTDGIKFKNACETDGTPSFHNTETQKKWCKETQKRLKESCFPSSFSDVIGNVDTVENEDGILTSASVYGIIAIVTTLYATFCVYSGPAQNPPAQNTTAQNTTAQNAPVPAPAQGNELFPTVQEGGANTNLDAASQALIKKNRYTISGLRKLAQKQPRIPINDDTLKALEKKTLVKLIRKWYKF